MNFRLFRSGKDQLLKPTICAATVLLAQESRSHIRGFPLLAALDVDGGGILTDRKVAAAPRSLECSAGSEQGPGANQMAAALQAADRNHDSTVTEEELRALQAGAFGESEDSVKKVGEACRK